MKSEYESVSYDAQGTISLKHSLTAIPCLNIAVRCLYPTTVDLDHSLDSISEVYILLIRQVTKPFQGFDLSISHQACPISSFVLQIANRGINNL